MDQIPDSASWYRFLGGITLATGILTGLFRWVCELHPIRTAIAHPTQVLGMVIAAGLFGMLAAMFFILCLKASVLEKVNTRKSWLGLAVVSVVTAAITAFLTADISLRMRQ